MKQLTIKAALLAGFGLTLGVWLFVGYQVTRGLAKVHADAADVNVRYMRAQELLASVRAQVPLASLDVRDALLDGGHDTAAVYRQQLEDTYHSIDAALTQYVPILDSASERARVERLRREIDEFRSEALAVLATDSARWASSGRDLLRRLSLKRDAVLRVSEEVQSLNRAAFVQQQALLNEMHAASQRRVWSGLGLALALSLAIGILATAYASKLETRLHQQGARELQHAIDLQRLSSRLIRAQEEERRRIARELHDEVGQVLSAMKVELALAERQLAAPAPGALDNAQALTDAALHAVRDLSRLLHPAVLDDLGLAAALDSYAEEFARRHALRVELVHEGLDERLPADVECTAYRLVQEALTNVARHARATVCEVHLTRRSAALAIAIVDDGIGFDVAAVERQRPRHGLGLVGMRERVTELGGTLRIESAPEAGTSIFVELPLGRRPSGQEERVAADADVGPITAASEVVSA